jgi:hypothetical protein
VTDTRTVILLQKLTHQLATSAKHRLTDAGSFVAYKTCICPDIPMTSAVLRDDQAGTSCVIQTAQFAILSQLNVPYRAQNGRSPGSDVHKCIRFISWLCVTDKQRLLLSHCFTMTSNTASTAVTARTTCFSKQNSALCTQAQCICVVC